MRTNSIILLLLLSIALFFFSGCYTQLKTSAKYDVPYESEYVILKKSGIFYKDYNKEMWYKDNFLNEVSWYNTDSTLYSSNKTKAGNSGFFESQYASAYPGWYANPHRFHRHYVWGEGFGLAFGPLYWAYNLDSRRGYGGSHSGHWYYNPAGFWSYYYYPYSSYFHGPYYFDSYWGTTRGWGVNTSVVAVYNDYTRAKNYSENLNKYQLGPRNSGLISERSQRIRANRDAVSRARAISRTSSSDTRVRRSGNSTGSNTRSTGRSRSSGDGDSGSRKRGGN